MNKYFLLTILVMSFAIQANAADWVPVNFSNDGITYGDVDSRTDRRAWFKIEYSKPQKTFDNKFYMSTKLLVEMNCNDSSIRFLTETNYSKSGNPVSSYTTPAYDRKYSYVVPDSIGEVMYNFVCSHFPR